jgi:antitoxin component YwqK of YwqJK toxin-antitoxin module
MNYFLFFPLGHTEKARSIKPNESHYKTHDWSPTTSVSSVYCEQKKKKFTHLTLKKFESKKKTYLGSSNSTNPKPGGRWATQTFNTFKQTQNFKNGKINFSQLELLMRHFTKI